MARRSRRSRRSKRFKKKAVNNRGARAIGYVLL